MVSTLITFCSKYIYVRHSLATVILTNGNSLQQQSQFVPVSLVYKHTGLMCLTFQLRDCGIGLQFLPYSCGTMTRRSLLLCYCLRCGQCGLKGVQSEQRKINEISVWWSRREMGRVNGWWKWRGERLEDGDIKMIISLYKAVNYKVIINQEILGVDIYNNVALINLLCAGRSRIKCAYDIPLASESALISCKFRKPFLSPPPPPPPSAPSLSP